MDEIERVLTRFEDADEEVRWKAVVEAESLHDKRVLEALLLRLHDRVPAVRTRAAQALRSRRDDRVPEAIRPLLMDVHPEVRVGACQALSWYYYREVLDALLERLHDREPEVRAAAAEALHSYYSYRALQGLIAALRDDHAEVRGAAAEALSNFRRPEVVEPLIAVMENDSAVTTRLKAIETLGYVVEAREMTFWDYVFPERDGVGRLLDLMEDEDEDIAEAALEALARIGDERALKPVVGLACNWDREFVRRLPAAAALSAFHDRQVVPVLIAMLQDPEPLLRPWAARCLSDLCDPASLPVLDALANDEPDELGKTAAKAAQHIRYELSWQTLEELQGHMATGDYRERRRALQCLGEIDTPEARELILQALTDALELNDTLLFCDAAKWLANAGEARALPRLTHAAEFWTEHKVPGLVSESEDAANYLRRKLNGDAQPPYESTVDSIFSTDDSLDDEPEDEP